MLACMEHTGHLGLRLRLFLQGKKVACAVEPALRIQCSMGIQRGKTDKADAAVIGRFAKRFHDELEPCSPASDNLLQLSSLLSTREALVRDKVRHANALESLKPLEYKELNEVYEQVIKTLGKKIAKVEAMIDELVASDEELKRNYELCRSVPGVGRVTACMLIALTGNFTRFADWRKFSCYCGTAPFPYSSGSSVRGRTKVSPLGHKGMKALLGLAVLAAVRRNPQFAEYQERKLKEGKHKLLVMNNLKNKLLAHVFATVKRGTPWADTMGHACG
jgi:transposase